MEYKPLVLINGVISQLSSLDNIKVGDYSLPENIGNEGQILIVNSGELIFDDPSLGVTDHGALTGLNDDDHSAIYYNESRLIDWLDDGNTTDIYINGSGRFNNIGVGISPSSTVGYKLQNLSVTAGYAAYDANIKITGTDLANVYGYNLYFDCAYDNIIGIGSYVNLVASSTTGYKNLSGHSVLMTPNSINTAMGGMVVQTSNTTINDPVQGQRGISVSMRLQGTDANMKRWAFYNSSTNITAGKMFLGKDNVKTYWGDDYDEYIEYDPTLDGLQTAGKLKASTLTDGTASLSSGNITNAVDGTFSGTVQAEQLTSTNDMTMRGLLFNTLSATDSYGFIINGTTYDYTGSDNCDVFQCKRDFNIVSGEAPQFTCGLDLLHYLKHTDATMNDGTKYNYGIYSVFLSDSTWTNETSFNRINTNRTFYQNFNDSSSYDTQSTGHIQVVNKTIEANTNHTPTLTDTGGNTPLSHYTTYGTFSSVSCLPTVSSGNWRIDTYGQYISVTGNTQGSHTAYGLYIAKVSGSDNNYAIYDNSGADWILDSDNQTIWFGESQDIGIGCNGTPGEFYFSAPTNQDITLDFVGTTNSGQFKWMEDEDYFEFIDTIKVSGLKSSDGSDGATADIDVAKVGGGTRTLHFKNGLYINYTDS